MADSTSNIQNSPSSSCSEHRWEYEVFLSFGGDTLKAFTDHLFHALSSDKGILTFRDKEGPDTGKPISPELLNTIENSRTAVVILSEKYASSTRCLEELAKIVECMNAGRMRVMPIFYHVDPSDMLHQKGTFADALRTVAGLNGHHLKDEPESEFIRKFVEEISSELNDTLESVYKDKYVGIESCVEKIVKSYIDMASNDVRFIGICGMSGIGKTTLAEVVFERIRHEFQASSFLRNVKRRDLGDSQDQLLRDMKLKSEIPRWDELKAINTASLRLRNKRVIIVVDDVDEEKLEKLAGRHNWFGPGSRIILTTEDKGMLEKKCGEKNVYQVKKLNASDALELFIREAFNEPPCEEDLLNICNDFVSYADGHPLELKKLGSIMHDIPGDLWKPELERLKRKY
ncbi:TMV resistance protein N-like [Corylus avellana]|uniref:TMV resistance protein N-like n=1 Tax=Corylus avellana TaxID=13451 RepID=UPI00286D2E5F|nr:TMV resistance protein N-like [Corylus avellana]